MDPSDIFAAILFTSPVILLAVFFNTRKRRKDREKAEKLRQAYETALNSGNRARALQFGRAYYAYLRHGRLTLYDEQAIANDMAAMPNPRY